TIKMGRVFIVDLEGKVYSCIHCKTNLTKDQDIMSKSFKSRGGQAYLFREVVTAHDVSQKYKEGKSVLELYKIVGPHDSNDLVCQQVSQLMIQ
ncbi:hypothetical protein F2Q69_00049140, partial [Brassica cretica]